MATGSALEALARSTTALMCLLPDEQVSVLERLAGLDMEEAVDRASLLIASGPEAGAVAFARSTVPELRGQAWAENVLPLGAAEAALAVDDNPAVHATILGAYDVSDDAAAVVLPLSDALMSQLRRCVGEGLTLSFPTPVVLAAVAGTDWTTTCASSEQLSAWHADLLRQVSSRAATATAVVEDQTLPPQVRLAACANDRVSEPALMAVVDELETSERCSVLECAAIEHVLRRRLHLSRRPLERLTDRAVSATGDSSDAHRAAMARAQRTEDDRLRAVSATVRHAGSATELSELFDLLTDVDLADYDVRAALFGSMHLSVDVLSRTPRSLWYDLNGIAFVERSKPELLWEAPSFAFTRLADQPTGGVLESLTGELARTFTSDVIDGNVIVPRHVWEMSVPWDGDLAALARRMPASILNSRGPAPALAAAAMRLLMGLPDTTLAVLDACDPDGTLTVGELVDAAAAAISNDTGTR